MSGSVRRSLMKIRACRPKLSLLLLLLAFVVPGAARAQMSIDEIVLSAGPLYQGGVFQSYFFYPVVFGEGIASVELTSSDGTFSSLPLIEVFPDEFICEEEVPSPPCQGFATLADIGALGTLTLDFTGDLAETDSVSFAVADYYDVGAGGAGFPAVIAPPNLATGVATTPTIQWSSPPSWVNVVEIGLEDFYLGTFLDDEVILGDPVVATTWSPTALPDGTVVYMNISFYDAIVSPTIRVTTGGRGFQFFSAYEAFNDSQFTVPEPGFGASLAAGLVLLTTLSGRTSRRFALRRVVV